jgi:hypothetical protein
MNKINDLDSKFKYETLKYKLKNKLVASDAAKASGTGSLLFFVIPPVKWNIMHIPSKHDSTMHTDMKHDKMSV